MNDTHLHRYPDLSSLYRIPTTTLHSAPLISRWIQHNIKQPLIIGPDSESAQWASSVAAPLKSPYYALSTWPAPVCLAVHAVFADGAYDELKAAGIHSIVTCNTIAHPSNQIDVGPLLLPLMVPA